MLQEIVNHLWQSTLFAVLIAVLCYWLRNDGAHVRYWLWWTASVKFFVPFSLLADFGARFAGNASVPFVPEMWTVRAEVVTRPFSIDAWASSPVGILVSLWALGSIVLIARWVIGALKLRTVLAKADADCPILVDGRRLIRVYRSTERGEPGIVGLFRPALVLPADIDERLAPAQLEAVLTHEIGHVNRRDNLLAAAHMLVEAVFWFHPFVWWIGARLIDERERACDELVVASGHDRETYAEGILDVCEHYAVSPLRCAAGISGSDLKRRITQIMRYPGMKNLNIVKKLLLGMASVGALTLPILAGLTVQQSALAQQGEEFPNPDLSAIADDEYLPIVKVAPVYPPRAAARGLEGYVVVEFTINASGSTENVVAIESSSNLFENSAIESALKYKYKPRVQNGSPVAVDGVRVRIVYALENDVLPVNGGAPDSSAGGDDIEEVTVTTGAGA